MIVVKTKTRGKPRGRKRPEIRKEHRTTRRPGIDTRVSTILATSSWSAMVGLPATRTEVRLRETMRQPVKQCLDRRAQQDQGSCKGHEQKVLNHVRRQHFVIERTQRRRDRQPDEK